MKKKIKLFSSLNRYAALTKADNETEADVFLPINKVVECEQQPQTEVAPQPAHSNTGDLCKEWHQLFNIQ